MTAHPRYSESTGQAENAMGIDKQSDIAANIQIGPTDAGMVRIYVEAEGGIELPLDFDPEEAEEIAEELRAAAEAARAMGDVPKKRR
jgi:DNA primase